MTFGAAIKSGFQNLTNFKGRARRSEFWWFYLFLVLISLPLTFLAFIPMFAAFATIDPNANSNLTDAETSRLVSGVLISYGIAIVLGFITFFLLLSVWVRRLHDGGYSGHFMWLSLIGLTIVPFIMAILDGQRHENQYGPDPKALEYQIWPGRQAGPAYTDPAASAAMTPPPYVPPAAQVTPQATQPLPPADPASDPFTAPPN